MRELVTLAARNERIVAMFRASETLQQIGDKYGLTRERVRQILANRGVTREEGGQALRSLRNIRSRQHRIHKQQEIAERGCLRRYGMTREQYLAHVAEWGNSAKRGSPMHRFIEQRRNALHSRKIGWQITFADWWRIWYESGHWSERGRGTGYCMARYGDSGPYSVDNVYICTIGQNFSDSWLIKHPLRVGPPHHGPRGGRGYWINRYPVKDGYWFRVRIGRNHFRGFKTREAAEAFAIASLGKSAPELVAA